MPSVSYKQRRSQLETYFDRTASEAWARLTSDDPVSRIRATVRAGREEMRATLLGWLPGDLSGARILDAGCGTGSFSIELAARGAEVVAVDISETLVAVAKERSAAIENRRIDFRVGDMLDPNLGRFDLVVAMDSLIHYPAPDMVSMVARLAAKASGKVLFTFAPRTPLLTVMHLAGRLFPRGDRAPAIEPIGELSLRKRLADAPELAGWTSKRTQRVMRGFYTSQALEMLNQ